MRKTRKCAYCGKEFVVRSGSQRYCSEECAAKAKTERKKRKADFMKAVEPAMDLLHVEFLTFAKAATLMGCSRQYVYKLVNTGKLTASRMSSRMAFIRRADIEEMLAGNPYHRVLPTRIAETNVGRKRTNPSSLGSSCPETNGSSSLSSLSSKSETLLEPLEYISGEEVMTRYKVKQSWLYTSAKRNEVPVCRIAGKNYYSRQHLDELFGVTDKIRAIEEWLTAEQAVTLYNTTLQGLRTQAYRRHIPTKREYGVTYYAKEPLDAIFRLDLINSEDYYTVAEVQEKFGLTSSNICHIVKVKNIAKIKVGVKNLLLKTDVDRVMAEREKMLENLQHTDK